MASLAEALTETFLPSSCAACSAPLPWRGARAGVCPECWASVVHHHEPGCPRCGDPESAPEMPCLSCRESPPPWRAAASSGPYQGTMRALVNVFKHHGRDELAVPLAALLGETLAGSGWPRPDAVTAVPVSWPRRLRRGFDQGRLLGRRLASELGVPFVAALRHRPGAPQVGRRRTERRALTAAAFPVRRRVAGRVLLVDDVFTTGATAAACSRALHHAGAGEVYVLTLARTPRPGRIP